MNLIEHQGKILFSEYGIAIPKGVLFTGGASLSGLGDEVVVKAQVYAGGRGKAGGVRICKKIDVLKTATEIKSMRIKKQPVKNVLIEEKLNILKEMYLSLSIDRNNRTIALIFTEEGGIDIETLAKEQPEKITRIAVSTAADLDVLPKGIRETAKKMLKLMIEKDCELVEINPLVETPSGLVAADSKVVIDDNSLFRHPEIIALAGVSTKVTGFNFVELDGNIGIIGNGAGLVMATLDVVKHFGGEPSNFLDVGGGAERYIMEKAMEAVLSKSIKGMFINIFGGITRCDEIAEGIVSYIRKKKISVPLAVRLVGTNSEEGKRILKSAGIMTEDSMKSCIKQLLEKISDNAPDKV
ncbi:MAG: ATP-grasp domain-containing protein [Candidatus Woesearchaeota archaeon]